MFILALEIRSATQKEGEKKRFQATSCDKRPCAHALERGRLYKFLPLASWHAGGGHLCWRRCWKWCETYKEEEGRTGCPPPPPSNPTTRTDQTSSSLWALRGLEAQAPSGLGSARTGAPESQMAVRASVGQRAMDPQETAPIGQRYWSPSPRCLGSAKSLLVETDIGEQIKPTKNASFWLQRWMWMWTH